MSRHATQHGLRSGNPHLVVFLTNPIRPSWSGHGDLAAQGTLAAANRIFAVGCHCFPRNVFAAAIEGTFCAATKT